MHQLGSGPTREPILLPVPGHDDDGGRPGLVRVRDHLLPEQEVAVPIAPLLRRSFFVRSRKPGGTSWVERAQPSFLSETMDWKTDRAWLERALTRLITSPAAMS